MGLADTLRWSKRFPMSSWPETHDRGRPAGGPNWRWLDLWGSENPRPEAAGEDFDEWWAERNRMHDRIWVAFCLPQFRVFDWDDDDIANARRLVSRHVCGVCARPDDSGCAIGC